MSVFSWTSWRWILPLTSLQYIPDSWQDPFSSGEGIRNQWLFPNGLAQNTSKYLLILKITSFLELDFEPLAFLEVQRYFRYFAGLCTTTVYQSVHSIHSSFKYDTVVSYGRLIFQNSGQLISFPSASPRPGILHFLAPYWGPCSTYSTYTTYCSWIFWPCPSCNVGYY